MHTRCGRRESRRRRRPAPPIDLLNRLDTFSERYSYMWYGENINAAAQHASKHYVTSTRIRSTRTSCVNVQHKHNTTTDCNKYLALKLKFCGCKFVHHKIGSCIIWNRAEISLHIGACTAGYLRPNARSLIRSVNKMHTHAAARRMFENAVYNKIYSAYFRSRVHTLNTL